MINLPYEREEQTAKDLATAKQTTCLHGLKFNTKREPGPLMPPDVIALGRMTSETMGHALFPMHHQRLTREFARHAACKMTAEVYCQLVAYCAYRHPGPHQVTYLGCVWVGDVLHAADDDIADLPVYVITQLGFRQHWPTHNVQAVKMCEV